MSTSTKIAAAAVLVAGLALIPILRDPAPEPELAGVAAVTHAAELAPPELLTDEEEAPVEAAAELPRRAEVAAPSAPAAAAAGSGSLSIQVVYAPDHAPAAGVGIELAPWNASTSVLDRDAIYGGPTTITDDEGHAFVDRLPPGHYWVSTNHRVQPTTPEIVAGEEAELLIELAGVDLEGIVVDAAGAPVAGASVELAEWARAPITVPKRVAVSDAAGRFEVRAVPTLCSVGARASGHAPSMWHMVLGGEGQRIELTLALQGPGGRLQGQVLGPEGEPVANASVLVGRLQMDLRTTTLPDGSKVIEPRGQRVMTDDEGRFAVDDCPRGEVPLAVRARAPELAPWTGTVVVDELGTTVLDIDLRRGVIVTGVARAGDGTPARRVEIEVKGAEPFADRNVVTAADGSYTLRAVAAGELEITAETDERGRDAATLSGGDGETVVWNPVLGHGLVLAGMVVDEAFEPVSGAFVHAFLPGTAEGSSWGHADAEGRFALSNCPEGGALTVRVEAERHGTKHIEGVDPRDLPDEGLVVRFPLAQEPARVVGDVLLPDGSPAASATIRGTGQIHATTGDTGRIDIEDIRPGTQTLVVEVAGYSRARLGPRTLGPGETWDVGTIRIQRGGSLLVRAGAFETRAYFQVFDEAGRWYSNVHLEDDTRASRLGLMEPGSYSLGVSGDGVAVQWIPFEVRAEEETVIDVELAAGVPGEIALSESVAVVLRLEREGVVLAHHWIHPRGDEPTRWTLAGFEPGAYVAEVEAADGRKGREEFLVTEGDDAVQVEIELF